MPLPDSSVDPIVSSLSLHHWDRPAVVFAELRRVLRPGGTALVHDLAALMCSTAELAQMLWEAGSLPVAAGPARIGRLPLPLFRRTRLDRPA